MDSRTNEEWLRGLRASGGEQASAIADLRALLLRGALYCFRRTQYDLSYLGRNDLLQLAEDSAQEALLSVLGHLEEFRGESKFTTWAYKFSINIALTTARGESWKRASLDHIPGGSELPDLPLPDKDGLASPDHALWRTQVWETIREVILRELSERQRQVLVAIVFEEVPMDEVARHFNTNRNAIYKLLHDARRKLKSRLVERGLTVSEIMEAFAGA